MSILSILASSNYITVNKDLIKILGLEEAVIFGELCSEYVYWEQQGKLVDGMFYCSTVKLEDSTGLSEYKQRNAIKNLIQAGYIEQVVKGLPATRYFKIITEQVLKIFGISSLKFKELDPKKLNSSNTITNKNSKQEKQNKEKEGKKPLFQENNSKQHTIENIHSLYLQLCPNLPKVRILNDKRKNTIYKAYKTYGIETIKEIFTKANSSSFLSGKNDRGWKPDIEWILGDHAVNILEGKYDDRKGWSSNVLDKPWERNVKSVAMTKEEREAEEREADRLEAQGRKARF